MKKSLDNKDAYNLVLNQLQDFHLHHLKGITNKNTVSEV